MDYQASKASFWKVTLSFVVFVCVSASQVSSLFAITITGTQSVSVTALVTDPNATTTSGNATSSTSTPPFSGGGGGSIYSPGTSFTNVVQSNSVNITGRYAPGMTISVLSSGNTLTSTVVDQTGLFSLSVGNLTSGVYSFLLVASDPLYKDKQYQSTLSYTVYVSDFAETFISDVIFPPLFSPVKTSFKVGSSLDVYGKALPDSNVNIFLDSKKVGTVLVTKDGSFSLTVRQSVKVGKHTLSYSYSSPLEKIPAGRNQTIVVYSSTSKEAVNNLVCGSSIDFSLDCRVNIVDFSILAYWYKRSFFPAKYDLNGDGKIDIKDFSIMAYHWTG